MPSVSDRNLLFGVLALQMDFITRDQLVAGMHAWMLDKENLLGEILVAQRSLSRSRCNLLLPLVEEHIRQHGDDPAQSLAALNSLPPLPALEAVAKLDADVAASINLVGRRTPEETPSVSQDASRPDPDATLMGVPRALHLPRFRIVRPHAEGGLGKVWIAIDTELGREVALKEIKPAYADDAASRQRFILEAEITGGLEHPSIVPVYGLGAYPDGRPFYAMRLIRGSSLKEAIADYHAAKNLEATAAQGDLAFRKLLQRFVDVCQAIAYAHSRGVLHRDLKPGNIMLGRYGETLVVDWGLAKALGKGTPDLIELPIMPPSRSGSGAVGPAMIGSHTAAGSAIGTPQYMSPEQAEGRIDELGPATDIYSLGATLYHILAGAAPFASAKDTDALASLLEAVKEGRFERPSKTNPAVPADLEAICLRAMARRPDDRHASAGEIADDVERWLASEEEIRKERELSRKLLSVTKFYENHILAAARPAGWGGGSSKDITLREALDHAALNVDDSFSGQPDVEAGIRHTLGMTYWYLGQFHSANPHLEKAHALRVQSLGPDHPQTLSCLHDLAMQRWKQGNLDEAERLGRRALEARRRVLGPEHEETLWTQLNLGLFLWELSCREVLDEAEMLLRDAVEACRRTLGPDHHHTLYGQNDLALVLCARGKLTEALELDRQTLEGRRQSHGPDHPDTLRSLGNVAMSLFRLGNISEAESLTQQSLEIGCRILGPEHAQNLKVESNLGVITLYKGDLAEAERLFRDCIQFEECMLGAEHRSTLRDKGWLAVTLHSRGDFHEAEALYRQVIASMREKLGPLSFGLSVPLAGLGALLSDHGRPAEAEPFLRDCLEIRNNSQAWYIPNTRSLLGGSLSRQLRFAEAEPLLLAGVEDLAQMQGVPANELASAHDRVIELYERWDKPHLAEVWRTKKRALERQDS